jgi:hypothetical protein
MQDINCCQTVARACALVYNWWSWYCRAAHPTGRLEAITNRPLLLAAVGKAASHTNQTTLYLTPMHGRADVLRKLIAEQVEDGPRLDAGNLPFTCLPRPRLGPQGDRPVMAESSHSSPDQRAVRSAIRNPCCRPTPPPVVTPVDARMMSGRAGQCPAQRHWQADASTGSAACGSA